MIPFYFLQVSIFLIRLVPVRLIFYWPLTIFILFLFDPPPPLVHKKQKRWSLLKLDFLLWVDVSDTSSISLSDDDVNKGLEWKNDLFILFCYLVHVKTHTKKKRRERRTIHPFLLSCSISHSCISTRYPVAIRSLSHSLSQISHLLHHIRPLL